MNLIKYEDSRFHIWCKECGLPNTVVQLGEEDWYESATTWVCQNCLKKALALFEQPEDTQ